MYLHKIQLYVPAWKTMSEFQGEMSFISHYDLEKVETKEEFRAHILDEFIKHRELEKWRMHIEKNASFDHLTVRRMGIEDLIILEIREKDF